MANAYGAYMTGVIGGYPNGGFPAQAFYGVMGQPAGMSKGGPTSGSGSADINFFGTSSKVTVLATILILMFGGYFLWHFTM